MRITFGALISVVAALAVVVNGHPDGSDELNARELEFADFQEGLTARELGLGPASALSELSTRELIDELSDRLEARQWSYPCSICGKRFRSLAQMMLHRRMVHQVNKKP